MKKYKGGDKMESSRVVELRERAINNELTDEDKKDMNSVFETLKNAFIKIKEVIGKIVKAFKEKLRGLAKLLSNKKDMKKLKRLSEIRRRTNSKRIKKKQDKRARKIILSYF